jgi:hypothetical protein
VPELHGFEKQGLGVVVGLVNGGKVIGLQLKHGLGVVTGLQFAF